MQRHGAARASRPWEDAGPRGYRRRGSSLLRQASELGAFLGAVARSPGDVGAGAPSGRDLCRAMAEAVDPDVPGLLLELGVGTGAITRALIERGFDEERLVLVEFDRHLAALLRQRHPRARVIEGDAFTVPQALLDEGVEVASVVSGLPLTLRPLADRQSLLLSGLRLSTTGTFVQFTYSPVSPVALRGIEGVVQAKVGKVIWGNLPPARVWTYRRAMSA